jgi:hypothetical protein
MTPITQPDQVDRYRELASKMMLAQDECEFNFEWVRDHGWKVVPKEAAARLPKDDLSRLTSVLSANGYSSCIAIITEAGYLQPLGPTNRLLGDMPTCYRISVNEADFQSVNGELGLFRFLLTDEERSWAISCNEWYNLYAGKPDLVAALVGEPIEQAHHEFFEFASELAKGNSDEPLMQIARRYASL